MSTATATITRAVAKPGRFVTRPYNVIVHNDEVTTFDFVMKLLQSLFDYDVAAAAKTTREIHLHGKAVVASYPKDIAEDKVAQAASLSIEAGFPLYVEAVESDE